MNPKELIPYLGFIPILWAIYNIATFLLKLNNNKERLILKTLDSKNLISQEQQFLLENIDFFETQNLEIVVQGKIRFFELKYLRITYLLFMVFIGIAFLSAFFKSGIYDYKHFLALIFCLLPCLILYQSSRRSIILDLTSRTVDVENYVLEVNRRIDRKIDLSNAKFEIDKTGIKLTDIPAEKQLEINHKLSTEEQIIWNSLLTEIISMKNPKGKST